MRKSVPLVFAIALSPALAARAVGPPEPVWPNEGAALTLGIPNFRWAGEWPAKPGNMSSYDIQIARDEAFRQVVDEDRIAAVIRWYVPDKELAPGDYWWRVAGVDAGGRRGAWSAAREFSVRPPERVLRVAAGANWAQVKETFAAAASNTPCRVVFERAEYRLDPGEDREFIAFAKADDLIIDGGGSGVTFTHPVSLVHLENCRRVMAKGFVFDFDPPAYTAGRVVAVDAKGGTIDAEVLAGHALPDAYPAFARDTKGMVVTEADGFAMKRGIPLVVEHKGVERVEGRRFRFRFERAKTASLFSAGDIYILDPRWYDAAGGHGAGVFGGEDIIFYDLTLRSAANECLGSFYSDRHAILRVRLERKAGRALSVNNGGNNHHNARTGPWIEGCLFENCGDDVCHVNVYAMAVAEQPAPNKLIINLHQPYDQFGKEANLDMRPGDRVQFFQRSTGSLVAEARVVSAVPQEKAIEVTVDRDVKGITAGRLMPAKGLGYAAQGNAEVTEVYNASRMCNGFVFRNNIARNGRRIGVLAKGDGGLVERNTFEGLGGGGVEFWNSPFEGLAAENYVVRGNRILGCGRLDREHAAIWATIFKSGGDRLQRNLLIEDNEIRDFPFPAMLLRDVADSIVRGNRIIGGARPARATKAPAKPIVMENCGGVKSDKNEFR